MTASTAEKTTGKRPGRPAADPAADAVDLSTLSFEIAEPPKRKASDNVFTKPLGESYETETARATTIPAVALKRVEGLLRRAAGELEIGVSIAATDPDENGNVVVTFMGKERRKRKNSDETSAAPEAGDAPSSNADAGSASASATESGASAESGTPTP